MRFRYKKDYVKHFDRLSSNEKNLVIAADTQIRDYYLSHTAPYGLRIKQVFAVARNKVFEARVSDRLRVMWLESNELVSFVILGNHDEVKRYLKSLR